MPPGTKLRIRFCVLEIGFSCYVTSQSVRQTDRGFAVRFIDSQDRRASVLAAARSAAIGPPIG